MVVCVCPVGGGIEELGLVVVFLVCLLAVRERVSLLVRNVFSSLDDLSEARVPFSRREETGVLLSMDDE